jgi:hypothetical protein
VNGRREGQGKMVWTTGEEYSGGWKNNLQQVRTVLNFLGGLFHMSTW